MVSLIFSLLFIYLYFVISFLIFIMSFLLVSLDAVCSTLRRSLSFIVRLLTWDFSFFLNLPIYNCKFHPEHCFISSYQFWHVVLLFSPPRIFLFSAIPSLTCLLWVCCLISTYLGIFQCFLLLLIYSTFIMVRKGTLYDFNYYKFIKALFMA